MATVTAMATLFSSSLGAPVFNKTTTWLKPKLHSYSYPRIKLKLNSDMDIPYNSHNNNEIDLTSATTPSFSISKKQDHETTCTAPWAFVDSDIPRKQRLGFRDLFEQAYQIIYPDRQEQTEQGLQWFTPSSSESFRLVDNAPLLLFLPGIDGTGLGLVKHHQRLAKIFQLRCLHIPPMDRTSFPDIVKFVETTVRAENNLSPNRPIYLIGESLGGCIALAVAANNPDIDLSLILSNPATSFEKSNLQTLLPMLEVLPAKLDLCLPPILGLMAGNHLRKILSTVGSGLSLTDAIGELSQDLKVLSSYNSVLGDILPKDTLRWKLHLLKSASEYTNSRLHAVKARTLVLTSERDQFFPSLEEGERLFRTMSNCDIRTYDDIGHFLFLEEGVDVVTILKETRFYRRSKYIDHVSDYIPPTPSEAKAALDTARWINMAVSPVMLSTMEDGNVVRGLAGIPSEGPVLLVGYHSLFGLDIAPLVSQLIIERNILVRGMAHPIVFANYKDEIIPPSSSYDIFRLMGAVPVSAANFYKLFSSKSHVLLYPGGAREALHRKGEEHKLFWPEQAEFVRMAARFGAKIVPFGTVGEDDLCEVIVDYDDFMKIPYFRAQIEELKKHANPVRLRSNAKGEVANQDFHMPWILPKFPGRYYYLFGEPIETEGRKHELRDRNRSHELYVQVQTEVEKCINYLKEKRCKDPYRNVLSRLHFQAIHGWTSEIPTFEL